MIDAAAATISPVELKSDRTDLRCLPNPIRPRTKLKKVVIASRACDAERFIGVENTIVVLVEKDFPALEPGFARVSLTVPVVVLINLATDGDCLGVSEINTGTVGASQNDIERVGGRLQPAVGHHFADSIGVRKQVGEEIIAGGIRRRHHVARIDGVVGVAIKKDGPASQPGLTGIFDLIAVNVMKDCSTNRRRRTQPLEVEERNGQSIAKSCRAGPVTRGAVHLPRSKIRLSPSE